MRKARLGMLLVLCLFLIVIIYTSVNAYGFRRHPRPSQTGDFFSSFFPHKVPACIILLKRGIPAYDHDLRAQLYQPDVVKNNPWNRWMLRRDALGLRRNELHLLARYPLPPDPALLPKIREALLAGEWSALALLRRIDDPQAEVLFHEWAEQSLTGPAGVDTFLRSLPYIVGWPSAPLTSLLRRFWSQLSEHQRAFALGTIARFLGESNVPPEDLLAFVDQALKRQEIRADSNALAVLGQFLARPATRERALTLLEREGSNLDPYAVESVITGLPPEDPFYEGVGDEFEAAMEEEGTLPPFQPSPDYGEEALIEPEAPPPLSQERQVENALQVLRRMAPGHPSVAIEALHAVAHFDIRRAEELAKPILAGVDSELRKGAIVILIRHGSELGSRFLDQAFKGAPPRRTSFSSISDYIYGSHAAEQYVQIAGHDYLEVGKSWPPAERAPLRWEAEARLWPDFIAEFPWFPGSDDAYYRLAYARYAIGGPEEAVATALEYFRRFGDFHPDGDAEPYLRFLVHIIAYGNPDLPAHADLFVHLHTLLTNPPGLFLLEENPELGSYSVALDWFSLRETERRILGADLKDLEYLRRLAKATRLPYGPARLQQARKVLQEEGASVPGLLYGRFPWLDDVQREKKLVEFSGENMEEAADQLTTRLRMATAEGDVRNCLALVDWLKMHEEASNSYYESGFEGEVFTPLFEHIEQVRESGNLCPRAPEAGE